MDGETLSGFFEEATNFSTSPPDHDIFSVLEAWEKASDYNINPTTSLLKLDGDGDDDDDNGKESCSSFEFQKSSSSPVISAAAATFRHNYKSESDLDPSYSSKRQKLMPPNSASASQLLLAEDGQNRISHIAVERNRRKQMNDHLSVLRSLMPCFYVKRGDQASIIGGVVDYINELQQVLQSLEAKKQRKSAYNEVLSPRIAASSPRIAASSPRPSPLSPRLPPLSPRLSLPISPRTPQQPSSPYNVKPWMQVHQPSSSSSSFLINSPSLPSPVVIDPSPCNSSASSSINDAVVNELVATSKSALAEVEVKFSGPNLLLKTVSHRVPGQVMKIVSAIEELALEILHVSITTVDDTMLNSFTIKCQLSAEDLAEQIQQTFC